MIPSRLILAVVLVMAAPLAAGAAMPNLPQLPAIPDDIPPEPAAVLAKRHYDLELLQKALLTEIPLNSAKCGAVDAQNTALREEGRADNAILRDKYTRYMGGVPVLQRQINAVDAVARQCHIIRDAESRNRKLLEQNKRSAEYISEHYQSRLRGDAILGHFGLALSHVESLLASFVTIEGNIKDIPAALSGTQAVERLRQVGLGGLFPQGINNGTAAVITVWESEKAYLEVSECKTDIAMLTMDSGATARTVTALRCLSAASKAAKFFESYGKAYELIVKQGEAFGRTADVIDIVRELYETKQALMEAIDDPDGTPEGPAEAAKILGRQEEFLMAAIKPCEAKLMPALDQ